MNLPNVLSVSRIILAPVFYLVFQLSQTVGGGQTICYGILIILFLATETSDIIDGHLARRFNQVSAIGKLLDPFSDSVTHITYFFCFVQAGFLAGWLFLLFLFRELGVIFLRMILLADGVTLMASVGGKIKSLLFAIASGTGIVVAAGQTFGLQSRYDWWLKLGFMVLFGIGLIVSILSFVAYVWRFCRHRRLISD